MNRRTRVAETVAIMTRLIERAWSSHSPNAVKPSAFTIATTLDKLQRACVKVARLHVEECNGDHERCLACRPTHPTVTFAKDLDRVKNCRACGGTERKSDDEVKAWKAARDRTERRIERMLRDLGFASPSATTGRPDVPTWEIDRDPRGGPLRIYEDQKDRESGAARCVFPVEGF